jgi:hypothetical protein
VVVDSYQNVVHLACFDKEVAPNIAAQAPAPVESGQEILDKLADKFSMLRGGTWDRFEKEIDRLRAGAVDAGGAPGLRTRFAEFDDADHPCSKWWEEHGQYMMSGGGRIQFIWACRGWIAHEQFASGVEVTGESLNETVAAPMSDAGLDLEPLKRECDRTWENEPPQHVINIAANALHWRKVEIEKLKLVAGGEGTGPVAPEGMVLTQRQCIVCLENHTCFTRAAAPPAEPHKCIAEMQLPAGQGFLQCPICGATTGVVPAEPQEEKP